MDLPSPPATARAVVALAAYVRERLAEVSDTLAPLWNRREGEVATPVGEDHVLAATARQCATVITGAAAPFAPTSYARARLLRQMHASGLLSEDEAEHAQAIMADAYALDDRRDLPATRAATGTEPRGVARPSPRPRP
jgi:hypothetical protein